MLMAQYMFVVMGVSPKINHFQKPTLHQELQGSIDGCPRGPLPLFSYRGKEVLGLEVVVALKGFLEDDVPLRGEL